MRNQLISILTGVLYATSFSIGQVSLEMEPIEATSSITDVTLYRNRAAITRTATLNLDAGGYSIFFRGLPVSCYLDSVQASVSDNAALLSVDTSSKPTAKDNSEVIHEINAEIEKTEEKYAALAAEETGIELQISMLKTLIDQSSNKKEGVVDLEALSKQLDFMGKKMTSLAAEKARNKNGVDDLKKQLHTLQIRKQNLSSNTTTQLHAIVDVGVKQTGPVQVKLTYLVNNTTWQPTYSIRANNAGDNITVEYDAELSQRTGENWADVNMTLSTAQPQRSTTPPMPEPWFVDLYVSPVVATNFSRGTRTIKNVDSAFNASNVTGSGDTYEGSVILGASVNFAAMNATVNNDGPAVSFTLPRTITVPSNSEDKQTTSLGAFETKADLFRIAVPMLTDSTFIRSKVTNTSNYILLPGRASIFHGSDYVGKTTLPTVAPGETFPLDLGIDTIVTATRVLLGKTTSSTGLFASGKQTMYEYRINISNGHDKPIELHVWDRYPVSRNEDIEVILDNLSVPLSTDSKYVEFKKPQGLLRWDLTIPANTTGDSSYVLNWEVEIARGKDIKMTPLPE